MSMAVRVGRVGVRHGVACCGVAAINKRGTGGASRMGDRLAKHARRQAGQRLYRRHGCLCLGEAILQIRKHRRAPSD
jgi:hypothetical protein